MKHLTNEEKQAIKTLNFIATFDGIITDEENIKYILKAGIEKFIPKTYRHLVSISENSYPIKIIIKNGNTKQAE